MTKDGRPCRTVVNDLTVCVVYRPIRSEIYNESTPICPKRDSTRGEAIVWPFPSCFKSQQIPLAAQRGP